LISCAIGDLLSFDYRFFSAVFLRHTLLGASLANVVVVRTDSEPGTLATHPHRERPSTKAAINRHVLFYDCTNDTSLICINDDI
jgi:hypothetical protein